MTSKDIRRMSEEELPDIDYFLNKLTLMTILEKNFLHPLNPKPSICHVHISAGSFPFRKAPHTVFPIKQSYKRLWLIIRVLEKRRLTDLNRWSGSCSPMPYHLAIDPNAFSHNHYNKKNFLLQYYNKKKRDLITRFFIFINKFWLHS